MQSLTLQPNVHDGVIVYEDSPLVSIIAEVEDSNLDIFYMTCCGFPLFQFQDSCEGD